MAHGANEVGPLLHLQGCCRGHGQPAVEMLPLALVDDSEGIGAPLSLSQAVVQELQELHDCTCEAAAALVAQCPEACLVEVLDPAPRHYSGEGSTISTHA